MDTLLYIDNYFTGKPSEEEQKQFEIKITGDPVFAEEVAFYLSAKKAAEQSFKEKNERFKDVYNQYKQTGNTTIQLSVVRKLWPYIAAAAVIAGIIFGWAIFFKQASPEQLADKYIQENFQQFNVTMGNKDSMQTGYDLFNQHKLSEALTQFESIAGRDTASADAKKYAGIVSLRLQQYDKAITYFSQLENEQLFANPGKLYHALTLLKRNQPGDKQSAKILLQQVVQFDFDGKETAKQLLAKW